MAQFSGAVASTCYGWAVSLRTDHGIAELVWLRRAAETQPYKGTAGANVEDQGRKPDHRAQQAKKKVVATRADTAVSGPTLAVPGICPGASNTVLTL